MNKIQSKYRVLELIGTTFEKAEGNKLEPLFMEKIGLKGFSVRYRLPSAGAQNRGHIE